MPRFRYPDPDEFELTDEEREAAARAERAPGESAAWGSALGQALGAIGGGALGTFVAPGLGTAAGAGLGASAGGAIGNALGQHLGNSEADEATRILRENAERRQKTLTDLELREQALDELLKTR